MDLAKYRPLLAESLVAYRTDSSYAEDMAKQARILRSRREAKAERMAEIDTEAGDRV